MTPREHQRVTAALAESFGDTPATRELAARYDVRPALTIAPSVPYAARMAGARRRAPSARGSTPDGGAP